MTEIVVMSAVRLDELTVLWTFNTAVTVTSGGPCANLVVETYDGMGGADAIAQTSANSITATYEAGVTPEGAWLVPGVPTEILFPVGATVVVPQDGTLG